LLLHGIGSHGAAFAPFMALMADGGTTLAWDMPGYGASAPLPMDWPVALDYAQAAVDAAKAINIDRLGIVGHSLGCLVAGAIAAAFPGLVDRVAFVSPALGHRTPVGATLPPPAGARIQDFERLGAEGVAKSRAPLLLAPANRTADLISRAEAGLLALRMPGYGQATRMLASGDLIADAPRIGVPALVVTGTDDAITPPKGGDLLAAALNTRPGLTPTRHVLIQGAGHMPFDEAPAALANALGRFFRS
jgi:pimeloyl-ACP methyl ester carboxylesterase